MTVNIQQFIGSEDFDPAVIQAMTTVPRDKFLPAAEKLFAYQNRPLAIGHGQTISQPYIVAVMTELLQLQSRHRVLEIGTGCGYQSAVLASLADQVYSIEIVPELAQRAQHTLTQLHYDNVRCKLGDGYYGWPDHAPFDAIIVTAAAESIPPALIEQLDNNGRMVIPLGGQFQTQQLVLLEKDNSGELYHHHVLPVIFVPFTRSH